LWIEISENKFYVKLKISNMNVKYLDLFLKNYLNKILKKYRIFLSFIYKKYRNLKYSKI